ncbi:RidA family protein [Streptomyces sp. DK15]|uniref:RidA family protein n=1 Tax=Streptomyces sp. DK15 TaxID=2957499 RepID=UPI0029A0800F|nr:RidA family protein [Streptomyces sp. DK15]MDX2394081.1 RidA family protein [Streptomyces sp. DK15]
MNPDPSKFAISTDAAPAPAGTYSQAVRAGDLVFLSGQTPRHPSGERMTDAEPFALQARRTLDNLQAVARAAGGSLHHAVKVNVYLRDTARKSDFDEVYRAYVGNPPPARTLTQTDLPGIAIEIDAVLHILRPVPTPPDS